jgi:hypothetical protein
MPRLGRVATAMSRRPAFAVAALVVAIAWPVLIVTHHKPVLALPRARAVAAVERSPATAALLKRAPWTRVDVVAIDGRTDSVWFYDGPRLRLAAIVAASGNVEAVDDPAHQRFAYGSSVVNEPRVLALLAVLFVVMTAVWPLWRVRNLDVLVSAASSAAIVLLNDAMLGRTVQVGAAALLYLGLRCVWRAFGPVRAPAPAVPLFDALTNRLSDEQRLRVLRMAALGCGLIIALATSGYNDIVDVGRAVMEGATDIVHGVLPYGHVPQVLHGDTYPIGSYLLYAPLAALWPVRDMWDSAAAALYVTAFAVLTAAGGLWVTVRVPRRSRDRSAPGPEALRLVIAWLTFPALLVTVTTGSTDAVLAALLVGVLLLWPRSVATSALLTAGAWFKLTPAALLPLALAPLRKRRLAGALVAIALVSALALAPVVALGGFSGVVKMWHAMSYQVSRASPQAIWALTGSVPLQQLMQALTLALVAGAAVKLRRQPRLAEDRTRVAASCAAIMIGLQLSASYWTYMYLVWALPGVLLSLFWTTGQRECPAPPGHSQLRPESSR